MPFQNARSAAARRLASELRTAVAMVERNPADQVARRPTTSRVLNALAGLPGSSSHAALRERSGLGASHLSNILKPLAAHGFVTISADVSDGRGRRIALTAAGAAAVHDMRPRPETEDYRDHVSHRAPRPAADYRRGVRPDQSPSEAAAFRRSLENA